MAKKINSKPYELVGFTYDDFLDWCKKNNKKSRDVKSKKEFFKMIYDYKLIKKDGIVIDLTREGE